MEKPSSEKEPLQSGQGTSGARAGGLQWTQEHLTVQGKTWMVWAVGQQGQPPVTGNCGPFHTGPPGICRSRWLAQSRLSVGMEGTKRRHGAEHHLFV